MNNLYVVGSQRMDRWQAIRHFLSRQGASTSFALVFHEKFFSRSATSNRLPQGHSYPRENIFFSLSVCLNSSKMTDNQKILANVSNISIMYHKEAAMKP